MRKHRILFVDDEENLLAGMRRMLSDQTDSWDMEFCSRPLQAMQLMQQAPFDVLVVDISMPGISGLELLAEVKADPRTRDTEVIVLTGLQDQSLKRQALNSGAADLLNKPIQTEDLIARMRGTLRSKVLKDELEHQRHETERQLIAAQRVSLIGTISAYTVRHLTEVMTSMIWYSDLARKLLTDEGLDNPQAESVAEALGVISSSSTRAKQQLEYILRLSRQESELHQPCDISLLVSEVAGLMQGVLPKGVAVISKIKQQGLMVSADPARLFQLVLNLALVVSDGVNTGDELHFSCGQDTNEDLPASKSVARISVKCSAGLLSEQALQEMIAGSGGERWSQSANPADLSVVRRIAQSLDGSLTGHVSAVAGTIITVDLPLLESAGRDEM